MKQKYILTCINIYVYVPYIKIYILLHVLVYVCMYVCMMPLFSLIFDNVPLLINNFFY